MQRSYDLHGTWDKGNTWTGNFLNAHTNLTEIDTALDLIWRNSIEPSKVVLGLAFYGRAFTASSASCLEPGCRFESGGVRGKCSKAVSVLLNSEIDDIIRERGITPKFYQDAAVKVASWDDQWVAYDDIETLKIKSQYAQSRCMGGVMVWAISHDTQDATYSMALAQVTNRLNSLLPHVRRARDSDDPYSTVINKHDQCRWTNCRQSKLNSHIRYFKDLRLINLKGCPSGWIPVPRQDKAARRNEVMADETGCGGGVRTFCCPPDQIPRCGWYNYNNGGCSGGSCSDGMKEIGSTTLRCRSSYQIACCTVSDTKSMGIYDTYEWSTDKDCDTRPLNCPVGDSQKVTEIAWSQTGSGGSSCPKPDINRSRKLCANTRDKNKQFYDCGTYNSRTEGCPSDKLRVALDTSFRYGGSGLDKATCCSAKYQDVVETLNPQVAHRREFLLEWLKAPTCPNPGSLTASIGGLIGLVGRSRGLAYSEVESLLAALVLKSFPATELKWATDDWNQAMSNSFPGLVMPGLGAKMRAHPSYNKDGPIQMAHNVICNPIFWSTRDSSTKTFDCSECVGPACFLDPKQKLKMLLSNSTRFSSNIRTARIVPTDLSLARRQSNSRDYPVDLKSPSGEEFTFTITLPEVRLLTSWCIWHAN